MKLADMQSDFRSWLTSASSEAAGRLGGPRAAAGLAIYQNNYRAQLVGSLEQAFPRIRSWIGEDAFLEAAIKHIDASPPHAWTLDAYPDHFGATLVTLYPNNPDLHELAWIEHTLSVAFVDADCAPMPLDALASVDWETASLQLAPSLHIHAATTNADSIWSALWQETAVPQGEMLVEAGGFIIWRRGLTSALKFITALEYQALSQLQHNGSFTALCDLLVERLGDSAGVERAGALLAGWLGNELIIGVDAA
jgi:hypothetical protein